jgi:hypothetical protein
VLDRKEIVSSINSQITSPVYDVKTNHILILISQRHLTSSDQFCHWMESEFRVPPFTPTPTRKDRGNRGGEDRTATGASATPTVRQSYTCPGVCQHVARTVAHSVPVYVLDEEKPDKEKCPQRDGSRE